MAYYIDIFSIPIDEYQRELTESYLLPSRMVLKDGIDKKFTKLKNYGINNVDELQKALKNKPKLQKTAEETKIPEDYLKVLIREVNSIQPKPNKIRDFPEITNDTVQKLDSQEIRNTKQLYDKILTSDDREKLAQKTGINISEICRLAKLTDLSRIRWVGSMFAFVLLKAGYTTAQEIAEADHHQLYERITKLNKENKYYKGNIGLNDMKLTVLSAKKLQFEIRL